MATATNLNYQRLMVSMQAPVARIILANPPVNVIDIAMMDELLAAMEQIEARADIAAVVFAGSDRAFSAGVDVSAHTPDKVRDMLAKMHSVMRALADTRKVTIAAVRGNCFGGGAELAAMCDLVFTTDTSNWAISGDYAGMLSAGGGGGAVGNRRAEARRRPDPHRAPDQRRGSDAHRPGQRGRARRRIVGTGGRDGGAVGQAEPASLAMTKKALYAWDAMHFEKGLARAEQIYLEELMKLEDAREGIPAFMEKRQPVWKGK